MYFIKMFAEMNILNFGNVKMKWTLELKNCLILFWNLANFSE